MKNTKNILLCLVTGISVSNAATISWFTTSATTSGTLNGISGANLDAGLFNTTGVLVEARNYGTSTNHSFDGITFVGTPNDGSVGMDSLSENGVHVDESTNPLSSTFIYDQGGVGDDGVTEDNTITITFDNLEIGKDYRIQLLAFDGRSQWAGRTLTVDTLDPVIYVNGSDTSYGEGVLFTGNFEADSASQSFIIDGSARGQINALTLHVPEPSSMLLFGVSCFAFVARRYR